MNWGKAGVERTMKAKSQSSYIHGEHASEYREEKAELMCDVDESDKEGREEARQRRGEPGTSAPSSGTSRAGLGHERVTVHRH